MALGKQYETRDLGSVWGRSFLRVSGDGKRVVVRDGGNAWQPESGQMVLDFEVAEPDGGGREGRPERADELTR